MQTNNLGNPPLHYGGSGIVNISANGSSSIVPEGKVVGLEHGPLTADRARALMSQAQSDIEEVVATIRCIVDHRIEDAAAHNMGSIYFTVPKNLFGYGLYDASIVGKRLAKDLHRSGFSVYGIPENLKIAWSRDAILSTDPKKVQERFLRAKKKEQKEFVELDDRSGHTVILPKTKINTVRAPLQAAPSRASSSIPLQNKKKQLPLSSMFKSMKI